MAQTGGPAAHTFVFISIDILMIRKLAFLIIFLFVLTSVSAQGIMDNNPPSVKWKQIKTPGFKIIYPEDYEGDAQHVANTLEHIRAAESETMGDDLPRRIPIVLQNRNAVSNGFVTLSPRRSEFYTMPTQNYTFIGNNKWMELLAVHEYRHIAQFHRSRSGVTKWLSYIFGQNTQALFAFISGPRWFWEGDATMIETAMTRSGRGRIAAFNRVFRANLLEGRRFDYNKQHLRSFRHYVPDHYKLGYNFVTHLRRTTNNAQVWDEVSEKAFSWPFIPFTFSLAMKQQTGNALVPAYTQMMTDMHSLWTSELDGFQASPFATVSQRADDTFTDYNHPRVLEDGTLVALKEGLDHPEQLVRIDQQGNELDRFIPGVVNNTHMLSATQYKVFWTEFEFDARWRARSYSVIKSYDFATGETRRITRKTRYAGAGISPDGYSLATVENTLEGKNHLLIIDATSGKVIHKMPGDGASQLSMAMYAPGGKSVVFMEVNDEGKAVKRYYPDDARVETLISAGSENIGNPVIAGNYLIYSSPYNGIDNLYAMDMDTKQRYQVTQSKHGAYSPSISADQKVIYYSNHQVNGLDIVSAPFDPANWVPLANVADRNTAFIEPVVGQEGHPDILADIPSKEYESKKYSKVGHMFNVHSWGPYATTDLTTAQLGVYSENVLQTTRASIGYTYDINEETGFASAKLSYQGWYPVLDMEITKGDRLRDEGEINGEDVEFRWREEGATLGISLPWLLTRSRFSRSLTIANDIGYKDVFNFESTVNLGRFAPINDSLAFFFRDVQAGGQLLYNHFEIDFFNLLKRSPRDIQSQWGQQATLELYQTLRGGDYEGQLFALRLAAFFPSPLQWVNQEVFRHHSFYVRYNYQSRLTDLQSDIYYFRNRVFRPRGYASFPTHDTFRTLSFNYTLPIVYPDIALGPFFNLQRIRANGFWDFGKGVGKNYFLEYNASDPRVFVGTTDRNYESIGVELLADFNVMRFPLLLSAGVRYSYLVTTGETNVELLVLNINL